MSTYDSDLLDAMEPILVSYFVILFLDIEIFHVWLWLSRFLCLISHEPLRVTE